MEVKLAVECWLAKILGDLCCFTAFGGFDEQDAEAIRFLPCCCCSSGTLMSDELSDSSPPDCFKTPGTKYQPYPKPERK